MMRLNIVSGLILLLGIVIMCAAQPATPNPYAKSGGLSSANREILLKFKARLAEIEPTAEIADTLATLNKIAGTIENDAQLEATMPTMVEVRTAHA